MWREPLRRAHGQQMAGTVPTSNGSGAVGSRMASLTPMYRAYRRGSTHADRVRAASLRAASCQPRSSCRERSRSLTEHGPRRDQVAHHPRRWWRRGPGRAPSSSRTIDPVRHHAVRPTPTTGLGGGEGATYLSEVAQGQPGCPTYTEPSGRDPESVATMIAARLQRRWRAAQVDQPAPAALHRRYSVVAADLVLPAAASCPRGRTRLIEADDIPISAP